MRSFHIAQSVLPPFTGGQKGGHNFITSEFHRVLSVFTNREDLFPHCTLLEIAGALNWSTNCTKIVLWNMLDRNLIRKSGRCMDEAVFFPPN